MNILSRMLFISLSTALLSFLAFGSVSFYNMEDIYDKTVLIGTSMGESIAKFTEIFAVKQAKERLSALALEKSKRIELGMSDVKNDAEAIAFQMKQIFSHPEKYNPQNLPKPTEKAIYSGEAYIHFAPELQNKELTSELKEEINLTSNIADVLRIKANFYQGRQTSLFIGSKNGYLICIDTLPDEHSTVTFTKEFNESYDPRERPWYKAVEKAGKTVVTDYYLSADGLLSIDCATPYYDSEGFAGVAAVGASLESLYQQVTEDKIGNTNINFTLSDKGEIVLSSVSSGTFAVSDDHRDLRKSTEKGLSKEIINMTLGKSDVALVTVEGKDYYLAYSPMSSIGWSYGTLIERDEVIQPANLAKNIILEQSKKFASSLQSFYLQHFKNIVLSFVLIIVLLLVISIKTTKKFVSPIVELTNGVKEIAKGNLDKKLDIKTSDEIEVLADSVNNMTSNLKEYMKNFSNATAEKERIATELNVAKNIQAGMLPSVEPDFSNKKEFDLAATMIPAKEVGGDFYDFYMLDENHLAVTVADVSGKGVGAALFMVISKTLLKDLTLIASSTSSDGQELDFASIVERANKFLYDNNEERMFVTVFYGVLNLKTGEFVYVNAGHNPPMVRYQKDGEFSFIHNEKKNPIIGVKRKIKYQEYRLTLSPGDMIFFYTDGITEAMNNKRELFNEKRLKSALDNMAFDCKAKDILSTVYKSVRDHVGDAEQSDDMTMLGLVYKKDE